MKIDIFQDIINAYDIYNHFQEFTDQLLVWVALDFWYFLIIRILPGKNCRFPRSGCSHGITTSSLRSSANFQSSTTSLSIHRGCFGSIGGTTLQGGSEFFHEVQGGMLVQHGLLAWFFLVSQNQHQNWKKKHEHGTNNNKRMRFCRFQVTTKGRDSKFRKKRGKRDLPFERVESVTYRNKSSWKILNGHIYKPYEKI